MLMDNLPEGHVEELNISGFIDLLPNFPDISIAPILRIVLFFAIIFAIALYFERR